MNLICFPHYTCGGLLCDILTDTFSPVTQQKGIGSFEHNIGKIGDSSTVFDNFDTTEFVQSLIDKKLPANTYVGTHCWPGHMNLEPFESVICITTMTQRSRIYRWTRSFYHLYSSHEAWKLSGMDLVDKQRETAKNYLVPFSAVPGAINIEFAEIVECSQSFQQLVAGHDFEKSLNRWQEINAFLYQPDFWNSTPVRRFYEAEYESLLKTYYVYE